MARLVFYELTNGVQSFFVKSIGNARRLGAVIAETWGGTQDYVTLRKWSANIADEDATKLDDGMTLTAINMRGGDCHAIAFYPIKK